MAVRNLCRPTGTREEASTTQQRKQEILKLRYFIDLLKKWAIWFLPLCHMKCYQSLATEHKYLLLASRYSYMFRFISRNRHAAHSYMQRSLYKQYEQYNARTESSILCSIGPAHASLLFSIK